MLGVSAIKLSEFFSICLHLVHESGKIIESVYKSKDFEKKMKGKDDPVTQADIHVQTLLVKGLRHFYPKIHIVGEEDVEFKGELNYDFSKINLSLIPNIYPSMKNEFPLEDSIVWIDPLDGTLSYVDNELDAVTTLIGVSYKAQPIIGIVGHYFQSKGELFEYNPRIYFGHKQTKQVHYVYDHEIKPFLLGEGSLIPWELKANPNPNIEKDFRIVCTKHRIDEVLEKRIKDLNGNPKLMGGCGKKIMQVITGKSDCYFYDRKGTKKWDTCACEALLLSLGGTLTTMNGDCYEYLPPPAEMNNNYGVLAMMDRGHHQKIIEITKGFKV